MSSPSVGETDEYVLELTVSRSEPDLSATFLHGDATLSGTAVRSVTDFGLTISPEQASAVAADSDASKHHTFALHSLVTEAPQVVRLRIVPAAMFDDAAQHPHGRAVSEPDELANPFQGSDAAAERAMAELAPFYVALPVVGGCRRPSAQSPPTRKAGKTLHINPRARLNVTCSRTAPGIDGTIVETMSGQGSVRIHELFARVETSEDKAARTTDATGANGGSKPVPVERQRVVQVPCYYSGWGKHSAVIAVSNARILHRSDSSAPFAPLNVCTALDDLNDLIDTPFDASAGHAIFYANTKLDEYLQDVEVTLTAAFQSAMNRRNEIVYALSPFMTKSVARVPVGLNACGYVLSSLCNDVPAAFDVPVVEQIYQFALKTALERAHVTMAGGPNKEANAAMKEIEEFGALGAADATQRAYATTMHHHLALGTALSVYQGLIKPYRLDGTPVMLPTGLQMVEAESWLLESNRSCLSADDCDGSATGVMGVLNAAKYVATTLDESTGTKFPFLRALHRTIGTFYLNGVSVLGATAGNADAAVDAPTEVAGHAVAIGIPIVDVLEALERGVDSTKYKTTAPDQPIAGSSSDSSSTSDSDAEGDDGPLCRGGSAPRPMEGVVKHRLRDATKQAYRAALLDGALRQALQAYAEAKTTTDKTAAAAVERFLTPTSGDGDNDAAPKPTGAWRLPPLAYEGTAPVCARLYEPDREERRKRRARSKLDKAVSGMLAPSVARTFTLLDASNPKKGGSHGFYAAFTEVSFSDTNPLFTNEKVRRVGMATTHLILCPLTKEEVDANKPLTAGVPPKQLHERRYALVPLFNMEAKNARIITVATSEARQNLLPRRNGPLRLSMAQSANVIASMQVLVTLQSFLNTFEFTEGAPGGVQVEKQNPDDFHQIRSVFSYAALVHNPTCIAAYANAIMTTFDNKDVFGHVNTEDIDNMAAYNNASDQVMGSILNVSLNAAPAKDGVAPDDVAPDVADAEPETDEERQKLVAELMKSFLGQLSGLRIHGGLEAKDGEFVDKAGVLVSVVLNVRKSLLEELPTGAEDDNDA